MFILNLNSRTIHSSSSHDGRCKLKDMQPHNQMTFQTYAEAMNYLPAGKKRPTPCSFCLGPNYSHNQEN